MYVHIYVRTYVIEILDIDGDMIQGCQIFLGPNIPNGKNIPNDYKLYQTAINYIKWPENIPYGHKIYKHFSF
jgi:hypothetical protein